MKNNIYTILRAINQLQRKHLPMFESTVDFNIAIEIGYFQESGRPLTLKQLFLLDVASSATVQRRLKLLVHKGLVRKSDNPADGRMVELTLTADTDRLFRRYLQQIERLTSKSKRHTLSERLSRNLRQGIMFNLIAKRPDEKACGTCRHWEGARETQDGMVQLVEDSEGVCRYMADQGKAFVDTLRTACQAGDSECWVDIGNFHKASRG
ncbi:MAG: hypothetical protein KGZ83_09025 [Sulfuricella sp.]|nr:hypothetical protein [Sulfuricella sp.]